MGYIEIIIRTRILIDDFIGLIFRIGQYAYRQVTCWKTIIRIIYSSRVSVSNNTRLGF